MLALIIRGLVAVLALFVGICAIAFASVAFEPVLVPLASDRREASRKPLNALPAPNVVSTQQSRLSQAVSA